MQNISIVLVFEYATYFVFRKDIGRDGEGDTVLLSVTFSQVFKG